MATVSRKTEKGGFDCDFVEQPPSTIQSECPVCLQILCEPYQAPCCGNSFCRVCIEKIKNNNKPCPACREENFVTFHDKRLQRSLYAFEVYCSHKQEGCEWKGELGQLDNHINLSPQPDKQLEGCEYSEIECIYCSELIKRCNITIHKTKDCRKTFIDCDFHHVGCDVRLPRKDMPAHLNENLVTHMSLQAASYSKLLASHSGLLTALQEKVNKLESENETLKHQLSRLQVTSETANTHQNTGIPTLSYVEFTMENFKHWKQTDHWYSPPFYSQTRGYKFCLAVDANGHGDTKGTHVSVFAHLMMGEFDDHLKWPFRGQITVQLVDQEGEEEHRTFTITYRDKVGDDTAGRVREREINSGWGKPKVISHCQLRPKYLKNDSLCFRITQVTHTMST